MLKRPFKSLIARIAIVALALSLVVPFVPAAFAQDTSIDYAENGTGPVASFTATDADGDAIEWSLSGPDAGDFAISDNGALSFKSSPNYESPADADSDNVYMVTLNAARGSTDVTVTVTNVDESGSVGLSDLQPQAGAGQSVTATISDTDGDPVSTAWQWSRSMDMTEWADIDGATAATYTPQEEDAGYYLRATATYSDGLGAGRDSASGETAFPVELRPTANFAPSFRVQDETGPEVDDLAGEGDPAGNQDNIVVTRMVKETAKVGASVGNAVTATDADNDPLIYRLSGNNAILNTTEDGVAATETVNSSALFKIDSKTGQISVKDDSKLDFESYATTLADPDATPAVARVLEYRVVVTATDPSGAATDPLTVTIKVTAVNEPPVIDRVSELDPAGATIIAAGANRFRVNTNEENPLNPAADPGASTAGGGLPVFSAVDPEDPDSTDIDWSVTGPDAGRFQIVKLAEDATADPPVPTNTAALRWNGSPPSFEAMDSADGTNVYEVTVRAYDGATRSSKTVTVTVDNIEENGTVSLSQRRPQEGMAITARLSDEDGNISGTKWQWYRGDGTLNIRDTDSVLVVGGTVDATTGEVTDGTAVTNCVLTAAQITANTDVSATCAINDGTSATYVPQRADAESKLQVRATYVDGFVSDRFTVGPDGAISRDAGREKDGEDGDVATATSEHVSVVRPNANTAPRFLDKGPVERSVAENVKGASVGDPVAGIDVDPLIYTLSGDDSGAFKIDSSGQLTTAKKLDYEMQPSYTITVTATDPSLSTASIMVNITVTDTDDPAVISAGSSIDYAENGTGPVASFAATDQDGDAIEWSLSGPDAGKFSVSASGTLSFKSSPNYESPADADSDNVYMVTLNAARGSTDVTVTVTNVDESGSVGLSDLQPQAGAGQSVTATISDTDGDPVSTAWQWSRSMDMTEWADIDGATAATYTPQEEDAGYYLRATATYSDGLGAGRDSASGETAFPVELRPTANFAPSFRVQDETGPEVDDLAGEDDPAGNQDNIVVTRMVKETAKVGASVGNAVTATDADNDPLLYRLSGIDAILNPTEEATETVKSSALFKIDSKTGQISVKDDSKLDFESYATTLAAPDADPAVARVLEYKVVVTATDPSGAATDPLTVTIKVTAVNEPPVIDRVSELEAPGATIIAAGANRFRVNTDEENPLYPAADPGASTAGGGLPVFSAEDPEDPASTDIDWSVTGPDAGRFQIVKLATEVVAADAADDPVPTNTAALRWNGSPPSFEAMDSADGDNVYEVTVRAYDGAARSSKTVTVTVDNIEEPGTVSLSQRRPQEGMAITARLSDEDGNISGTKWQWYRGEGALHIRDADSVLVFDSTAEPVTITDDVVAGGTAVTNCVLTAAQITAGDIDVSATCAINDGTSATYVPQRADAESKLQVRATYVDAFVSDKFTVGPDGAISREAEREKDGEDGDVATATSEHVSVVRPNANTAPRFLDKGPVERSVAENVKGASVGDPVAGIDVDPLIYTLSGDDAGAFEIDSSGQLTTAKKLDYETQPSYTITVTATDPSLSSASIMVNITVTDTDDAAVIVPSTENSAPAFASESVTFSVDENAEAGAPVGDPITATDKDGQEISYSLDDDSVVEIWPSGQLTVAPDANLDYESDTTSYTVILTASDGIGGSSIEVIINVNNVGLDNGYDTDDNGEISKDEAIAAVDDYFLDNITRDEVNGILALYFG